MIEAKRVIVLKNGVALKAGNGNNTFEQRTRRVIPGYGAIQQREVG